MRHFPYLEIFADTWKIDECVDTQRREDSLVPNACDPVSLRHETIDLRADLTTRELGGSEECLEGWEGTT